MGWGARRPGADARASTARANTTGPAWASPGTSSASAKVKVKLADGKARNVQHMMCTTFWHPDGTPMSAQQFMELLFGKLPEFFKGNEPPRHLERPRHTQETLTGARRERVWARATGRDAEDYRCREERYF